MTADPSLVRWIFLGLLMVCVRQVSRGVLRVSVSRGRETDGPCLAVRIGYEVQAEDRALTDSQRWSDPQTGIADLSDLAQEDLVLKTCLSYCETLGGELTRVRSDGEIAFLVTLPVDPPEA
jgi:hypothetical protein